MISAARSHPTKPLAAALVAVLLTTCAGPRHELAARPASGERRTFPVLDQGGLSLEIPPGWRVKVLELDPGTAASIRLDPPGGGALFIAPVHSPESDGPVLEAAALFTEIARRKALGSSGGRELLTAILRGPAGDEIGYWFIATDAGYTPPGPGQERFLNMMRGGVSTGQLLVTFTWFDDTAGPAREQVLALVRGARHEVPPAAPLAPAAGAAPGVGEGGPAPFELTADPKMPTVPLAVQEPGSDLTVLLDLPGFEVYAPRASPDGAGYLVLGQHPETGIVASVTIGPEGGAAPERASTPARGAAHRGAYAQHERTEPRDARACRDDKLARLRRTAPDLGEVRTADAGEAPRLRYVLKELRGREIRQEHAHAFLAYEGRCVDVHVSKADPEAADAGRIEAILATARFAAKL